MFDHPFNLQDGSSDVIFYCKMQKKYFCVHWQKNSTASLKIEDSHVRLFFQLCHNANVMISIMIPITVSIMSNTMAPFHDISYY